jgi:transcriptional enhancer factor
MPPMYQQQPRPVLPSQGMPHAPEYMDARRGVNGVRQPLREAAGNAQAHSFNSNIPCYQTTAVSSIPPTIPTHIVPSQSIEVLYSRLQAPRHQPRQTRKGRQEINPLYFCPAFKQYRNRQAHKDTQKDKGGVWRRPELEDAFVDCKLPLFPFQFHFLRKLTNFIKRYSLCLTWAGGSFPWPENFMAGIC